MFSTVLFHAVKPFCLARLQTQQFKLHWGQKLGQRQAAEHAGLPPVVTPMSGGSQVPNSGPTPPVYTTRPALITLWLKQGL